jgi:endoglucanase
MSHEPSRDLLRRLTLAPGAPGAEDEVRRIVRGTLDGVGPVSFDRLGSIICEKVGTSREPRVQLDAHLDEVALMVQSISSEGRLGFVALGGWWGHVLLAQRVDVVAGGRLVPGVIGSKPPHSLDAREKEKVLEIEAMYIDVGASTAKEVEDLGIRVGDPVVPHAEFVELGVPDILSSKAFDNRVGVGLLCEAMLVLRDADHPNTVVGVGAVQEEVGCRGATTSSAVADPDVAIILEGTPADDLPGFTERQAVLGKGPQIRFFDPTAISNRKLARFAEKVAGSIGVGVQIAVRKSGGTDARSIHVHGAGVPAVVIGVPARYIHTHVSLIHWGDYVATLDLVVAMVRALDGDTVRGFTDFGG